MGKNTKRSILMRTEKLSKQKKTKVNGVYRFAQIKI